MKQIFLKSYSLTQHLIAFILIQLLFFTGCNSGIEIQNPYSQVDWKKDGQYKANLHTHTTRSDGSVTPQGVVDNYSKLGYHILAITDHNEMTYPWTEFEKLGSTNQSKDRLATGKIEQDDLVFENRDPLNMGMIAVQGCEVSSPQHLGSYFTNTNQRTGAIEETLDTTAAKNGLIIFNHPGKYSHNASWYCDFFQKYNHIVGVEVFNQRNRYPNDLAFWDSILVRMMPERPVWGFSNDDMHANESIGHNWNSFVLPELSLDWVRCGMEQGSFFFIYAPTGHNGSMLPQIKSVKVERWKATIEIESIGQDSIRWISGGNVISRGNIIHLQNHTDIKNYVRAEVFGSEGCIVGTQPFGIKSH